ncbi:hypothetical protein KIN20_001829 [Parelaphostrongylus tenuis]|uniref:Uncharacterized protein n=1 Tax=Parelaphostrongylus tenuis TaxID=148309 RepID=A0AAD5QD19_PARTN|nr:hypothetical protein KIN20_001829 [Parelaphostrongylus tenuis]
MLDRLIATLVTPILRGRISCFGSQYCFPLAFGVPGLLMVVALLIFLGGWRIYKKYPPSRDNVASALVSCIYLATMRTLFQRSARPASHWLHRAAPEHILEMIEAVRSLVNIVLLFCPLFLFWALFDQQGSTWVLQARRLDGRIGWINALPKQINILNPLIVIIMVPVFEGIIYPFAKTVRITFKSFSPKIKKKTQLEVTDDGTATGDRPCLRAEDWKRQSDISTATTLRGIPVNQFHPLLDESAAHVHLCYLYVILSKLRKLVLGDLPVSRTEIEAGVYNIGAGNQVKDDKS